jgi:hypothetical protein
MVTAQKIPPYQPTTLKQKGNPSRPTPMSILPKLKAHYMIIALIVALFCGKRVVFCMGLAAHAARLALFAVFSGGIAAPEPVVIALAPIMCRLWIGAVVLQKIQALYLGTHACSSTDA